MNYIEFFFHFTHTHIYIYIFNTTVKNVITILSLEAIFTTKEHAISSI